MRLGQRQINLEMQRMKDTGKIDGLIGAHEVGRIIDHHNQLLETSREKDYDREITNRNQYYWKLWKRAIEEMRSGFRPIKKLVPKNVF